MAQQRLSPALKAVSDAVLAVASQRSVDEVLQRLVDSARELAGARYAALGIPDGAGGFRRFLVSGMDDELIAAMGPLPRTPELLGAMLEAPEPFRSEDIHTHPRLHGWWPKRHPDMRSFLGGSAEAGRERDGDVLRIAQEAIHNALRHSGAGHIAVVLERTTAGIVVEVTDDGSGFDPDDPELRSRHLGLTSIEERAAELGARLQIRSAPGRGTVVALEVARDG